MGTPARTTATALAALIAALVVACTVDEGRPCYPGDYQACACGDAGTTGYARCDPAGQAYGACDCSGSYPFLPDAGAVDAPPDAPADAGGGARITDACMVDSDCAPGLQCFHFNARGFRCTHACNVDSDCEQPSPGCSMMKVCKSG